MQKKIDISSTVIEKGLDGAKVFLDKLIIPTVEETGLLLKDKVILWRFKNQVRMLNKAKKYCEKNNISPKTISLKLLCPLLDNSSLEEEETLQDKWAILLSNLVDSSQNIENHVFPYILGQISTNEFLFLEQVYFSKKERISKLSIELEEFKTNRPKLEKELLIKIENLEKEIVPFTEKGERFQFYQEVNGLRRKKRSFERKLDSLKYKETSISISMKQPEVIPDEELKGFELSNLIRLGIIKTIQENIANYPTLEIPRHNDEEWNSYVSVELDIEIESNIEHVLTELGELFVDACTEKKRKTAPNK